MGQGNKKLSKRDPEASLLGYRTQGFLPEGLLNYLALLGWAIGPDRDVFTIEEMVAAFDIGDVNPNPARFDLKKAEAINADHMRMLSIDDLTHRVLPFLKEAGVVGDPVHDADAQLLELAMPLVAERMNKLTEAPDLLGFLFVDEADFRAYRRDRRRRARGRRRVVRRPRRTVGLVHRVDRDGSPRGTGRAAGAQAPPGVRAGPGRGDRQPDQPPALRVAGAAGSRAVARPPRGRARVSEAGASTGLPYHRLQEAGLPGWWRPVVGTVIVVLGLVRDRWHGHADPVRHLVRRHAARTCRTPSPR